MERTDSRSGAPGAVSCGGFGGNDDFGVVLQFIETAVGQHVAGGDTGDFGDAGIGNDRLNNAHVGDIVLNHVDEGCLAVVLDRGGGNQRGAVMGINEKADIDEFIGEERSVLVVERGAGFYGAGGRVDLIVEGEQQACGEVFESGAVKGVDSEFRVFAETSLNLAEIVLRNGEDCGDGLDLRDDDEREIAGGLNDVARIDEAQANPAGDRRDDVAVVDLDLIEAHHALVEFDCPLLLEDEFFLIVEGLLGNGVAVPGVVIALEVHF